MYPYRFSVSLRLKHPAMSPETTSGHLRRRPTRAWKIGDPRRTPTGTELGGTYRETYWYRKLTRKAIVWSKGKDLESYLNRLKLRLYPHARFFRRVCSGGGNVELFIGIYGQKNYGFELPSSLLTEFGRIGVSLSFDIYDYPQNW
jgi:Domain of unknown function (DUF4279)